MRGLWDPQSPELAPRLRFYQSALLWQRVELINANVTRLEVIGDKAISNLTSDDRFLDKKTGAILSERDVFHGVCRSFEWVKTGAGWKIEREFSVQDELAAKLDAATSERERDELLIEEKAFVTDALLQSLGGRGHRYRVRVEYDAALRCYHLQQVVSKKIGDQAGIATALANIGVLKYAQDELEEALLFQQKALALFEAAGLKRGVALALSKLSEVYHALGDERLAFECAKKALGLYEVANDRRRMVYVLAGLGYIYEAQNDVQQTLAHFERALSLAQEVGDLIEVAVLRHDVAKQYQAQGNYERALEIYQQLLKQTEGFGDRGGAALIRGQIGNLYASQQRYGEALDYHRQALSEIEATNTKRLTALALTDLSDDYLAQGRYAEALPLTERAVSLSRQVGWQLDLWLALTSLGYCQLGLNHPLEAQQAFTEAVSIIEKLRTQTAGGAEERERYFESRLLAHLGMLSLLVKENRPLDALVFAERMKARVLLDVLEKGRVSIQKATTLQEREQERLLKSQLTRLNMQLARATQSDKPDPQRLSETQRQPEKARLDYEAFQTSLYATHPELKIRRGESPIIKAEELASFLPNSSTAVLEYVVTADQSYLFVITRAPGKADVDIRLYTLPIKRAELNRQTEAFRQQLAGRDLGFRASGEKIYELLLKPAQAQLKGKTNLIIVPDDTLWELPFQALQNGAHRFLLEDTAIAYAPSLTVLREMTRRRKDQHEAGPPTLLAVGNPTVDKQTVERATLRPRDAKLTALPEAEQEVKALVPLYGTAHSKIYIGPEAREDIVKRNAGGAGILHFATHGTLNNASPMYSYLVLAQGDSNEDGLLEAWELMQMDLKADLAILSACDTARGRFGAGEGMIGLSWAMFVAGVPTTVVSQWQVEAASTRDLMVDFHRILNSKPEAGKTQKAEALREAELKLMKNPATSHPFYWAGFVLVGDGS